MNPVYNMEEMKFRLRAYEKNIQELKEERDALYGEIAFLKSELELYVPNPYRFRHKKRNVHMTVTKGGKGQ